jgi:2,3-diaminopropionate biosynthesis protein SbnB
MENANALSDRDLIVLSGDDVAEILAGQELSVLESVRNAYLAHAKGRSSLPHSTFLTFPEAPANRIIALPAYLGDGVNSAGMKWIASFPGNVKTGVDRASAVLVLNSTENGRPRAVLEGSLISAWRTAASAALAARALAPAQLKGIGLIGCGVINFEILRFLRAVFPKIDRVLIYDLNKLSAATFRKRCGQEFPSLHLDLVDDSETVFRNADVISFATTAAQPYVPSLSMCGSGAVVLHISLRDLAPEVIMSSDNVVDDIDHVCRARTSIHLAEQLAGHLGFVRCTLGDLLMGKVPRRADPEKVAVFSPFGLGILDIAVGELVLGLASTMKRGLIVRSFLPLPWRRSEEDSAAVISRDSQL